MNCKEILIPEYVIPSFKLRNAINFLLLDGKLRNLDVVKSWLEKENINTENAESKDIVETPMIIRKVQPKRPSICSKEILAFLRAEGLISLIKDEEYSQLVTPLRRLSDKCDHEFNVIYKCFFDLYFEDFQRMMMSFAKKKSFAELIKNFNECTEEGFQDGYIAFYNEMVKPEKFDFSSEKSSFKNYFLSFCSNHCCKHATEKYRYKQGNNSLKKEFEVITDNNEDREEMLLREILYTERQKLLLDALKRLDKKTKTLLELRFYEGLKRREISERLSMDPNNISHALNRGQNKLRRFIEKLKKKK